MYTHLVFITLSQQNPNTEQPPQSLPQSPRLNKLIIPVHKHLTNRLGIRHQDTRLIEQPAIMQHAIIRHVINPISLRFTRRILEDASVVTKQEMRVLIRC